MSGRRNDLVANARWEYVRLLRSRRIWLLLIPPVAAPLGSAISDLVLGIPTVATARILGLLIAGGLGALVLLDLTALAVGEDLVRRAHLTSFPLPQDRRAALTGRLLLPVGGSLVAYLVGATGVWVLAGAIVHDRPGALPPLFLPDHLALAVLALLVFLAGVTALGAALTRSSSEALVSGILAAVLAAGGTGYLTFQHALTAAFPVLLGAAGGVALVVAVGRYPDLEG